MTRVVVTGEDHVPLAHRTRNEIVCAPAERSDLANEAAVEMTVAPSFHS